MASQPNEVFSVWGLENVLEATETFLATEFKSFADPTRENYLESLTKADTFKKVEKLSPAAAPVIRVQAVAKDEEVTEEFWTPEDGEKPQPSPTQRRRFGTITPTCPSPPLVATPKDSPDEPAAVAPIAFALPMPAVPFQNPYLALLKSKGEDASPRAVERREEGSPSMSVFTNREGAKRRLSFHLKMVPDALVMTDADYVADTASFAGEIFAESKLSDDEYMITDEEGPSLMPGCRLGGQRLDDALALELHCANDESDKLGLIDHLDLEPQQLSRSGSDVSVSALDGQEVDLTAIKEWFNVVEAAYGGGVKAVKVADSGKKYMRTIYVHNQYITVYSSALHENDEAKLKERCFHFAAVDCIKLGYSSPQFRKMLDIANENEEIPPNTACAFIVLEHDRHLSFVFPSEAARNEFVFFTRVKVREARSVFSPSFSHVQGSKAWK